MHCVRIIFEEHWHKLYWKTFALSNPLLNWAKTTLKTMMFQFQFHHSEISLVMNRGWVFTIASSMFSIVPLSHSQFQFHHSYYEPRLSFHQAANPMAVQFQALCLAESLANCVWEFGFENVENRVCLRRIFLYSDFCHFCRASAAPTTLLGGIFNIWAALHCPTITPSPPYSIWPKIGIRTVSRGGVFVQCSSFEGAASCRCWVGGAKSKAESRVK